jgi:hypothetical protein
VFGVFRYRGVMIMGGSRDVQKNRSTEKTVKTEKTLIKNTELREKKRFKNHKNHSDRLKLCKLDQTKCKPT